ncbi:MAG: DUF4886 domain-containing protein [Clostridia bacterium]|nr:DUF4886 domain-containing protein [Clostridia bacterium]
MKKKRYSGALFAAILLSSFLVTSCAPSLSPPTEDEILETEEILSTEEWVDDSHLPSPGDDGVLDILLIGNSFCTGFPDEMCGVFKAAGVKTNIYSVYYSGCTLEQHWTWHVNGEKNYRLRYHKQEGGHSDDTKVSLDFCLEKRDWDVISLQQSFHANLSQDYQDLLDRTESYAKNLYDYLRQKNPEAKLYWHQTWAYEVGFQRNELHMKDVAMQNKMQENIRAASHKVVTDNGVAISPTGEAWVFARANPLVGDTLTRDQYHDGPEGGGQYLNACTWLETLTGISCIGNPWRPSYALSETKIIELQKAAHAAVAANTFK